MPENKIQVPGRVAVIASIGEVCVQWARLEMTLLGLICTVDPTDMEKGHIIYGGLDILPRATMAINLARQNNIHPSIAKRIVEVRKALQNGLADRRNQVVHGAHHGEEGAETTLTMVRWKGDKKHKRLSATEIGQLASEIHELGN